MKGRILVRKVWMKLDMIMLCLRSEHWAAMENDGEGGGSRRARNVPRLHIYISQGMIWLGIASGKAQGKK